MSAEFGWVYTDKAKDHFTNPRNVLKDEEHYADDGKGIVGNIKCGDQMMVAIKVDKEKQTITDCKWKTYGCASAIASTSVMSEMVKGLPLEKAYHLSPKDIAGELGGLPEHKIHCSVLGDKALRAAINNYYIRNGMQDKVEREKARLVCQCMNVTDAEIEQAVLDGARTYYELQERTKLGTVCGQCKGEATRLLGEYVQKHFGKRKG
jgi:nitrogen fixation protein NifU and related proteins